MMRIQELRESRGIVIKLFYHTLALLHLTFLFHIPDTSIWMGQKHAFSPAFYLSTLELYSEKIIVQYSSKKTCYIDFAYFSNRLYKINLFFCFIFFPLYGFLCLQFFSSKSFVVDGSKGIVLCQKRCICWMHKQHICLAHARI